MALLQLVFCYFSNLTVTRFLAYINISIKQSTGLWSTRYIFHQLRAAHEFL